MSNEEQLERLIITVVSDMRAKARHRKEKAEDMIAKATVMMETAGEDMEKADEIEGRLTSICSARLRNILTTNREPQ